MNVYIQLTSAGVDTGPFSLYSDVDAYASPFQTNISRAILLNGFTCTVVPALTTIIRIQSENDCTNYIDITIQVNPTTTTTTSSTTTSTTSTTTSTTSTTTTTTTASPYTCIEYGYLYNWYAATDVRLISSSDDWVVPTLAELVTLREYLGGASASGGKLKETGFTYWLTPNTGATNESGFNGRGCGYRNLSDGTFNAINVFAWFISTTEVTSTSYGQAQLWSASGTFQFGGFIPKGTGSCIRLLYKGAGTPTSYTGNDGKVYRVVTIGTQTWLADNLAETKYRNGDWIHGFEGGIYTAISDVDWAALTTEGMCAYQDSLFNALCVPPTTTTTTTAIPIQQLLIARTDAGTGEYEAASACGELYNTALVEEETIQVVYFQSASPIPVAGQQLFVDVALTTQFLGSDGTWWASITDWDVVTTNTYDTVVQIAAGSEVLDMVACAGITTTTTTTLAYHMDMCVNSTTYDEPNEVSIPISLSPTVINSPTKAGYNYFFLSIPTIYTFTLQDSLGTDITSSMSLDPASGTIGTDIRPGYHNNYIYKSEDTFATDFSTEFTLTLS